MKKLVIKIEELPVRAHKLDPDILSKVFGGVCLGETEVCLRCDGLVCCSGYYCDDDSLLCTKL